MVTVHVPSDGGAGGRLRRKEVRVFSGGTRRHTHHVAAVSPNEAAEIIGEQGEIEAKSERDNGERHPGTNDRRDDFTSAVESAGYEIVSEKDG